MTPGALRAVARALRIAVLVVIASATAHAGELYRWVTEDGRVEIGPNPPPGTTALPWLPGQGEAARPASPVAPAARGRSDAACARSRESARKAAREVLEIESEIARLEQRLEALEASDIAYSRTSCVSQGIYGPSSDCRSNTFHRDTEIANAEQALDLAQDKLADLELRARGSALPAECAPASND